MSVYKTLQDETQVCRLNKYRVQGGKGILGNSPHMAGKDYNIKLPPEAPSWLQAQAPYWLQHLSSSFEI